MSNRNGATAKTVLHEQSHYLTYCNGNVSKPKQGLLVIDAIQCYGKVTRVQPDGLKEPSDRNIRSSVCSDSYGIKDSGVLRPNDTLNIESVDLMSLNAPISALSVPIVIFRYRVSAA